MFAIFDCNNFYASCERVFNPHLIGKPVVVLSNNDGCIIARSEEAKQLGIPMGAPFFEYEKVIKENNVFVFSSNYTLYGDMSRRVMNIIQMFCPEVEVYSIDEAFVDLSNMYFKSEENIITYFKDIRQKILKWTGIPVSIGIAPTKTLAKVANKIAKKFPDKTNYIHLINNEELREKALKWIDVEDIWGIGQAYTKKLNAIGVFKGWDFVQLSPDWVRKNMTIQGWMTQKELMGIPMKALENEKFPKSVATSRSFEKEILDHEELKERIAAFANNVSNKLKKHRAACRYLMVFIRSNPFKQNQEFFAKSHIISFTQPIQSFIEIIKAATFCLDKMYQKDIPIKKAGVVALGLVPENEIQLSFESNLNQDYQFKLLQDVVLQINKKFKKNIIHSGAYLYPMDYNLRKQFTSKCYTTRWDEILSIKT